MNVAEDRAETFNRTDVPENYTFYNAKHSYFVGDKKQSKLENNKTYTPMELHRDNRFYNISVNLNYSMVHVPTNVYDRGRLRYVLHVYDVVR
jgi:voltage-dependent calcium channel alpha-2/delta-4